VLPKVTDMPTGWFIDPDNTFGDDGTKDDSVVHPAACDDLFNGLDKASVDPAAKSDEHSWPVRSARSLGSKCPR
jgi:hypothetical protein